MTGFEIGSAYDVDLVLQWGTRILAFPSINYFMKVKRVQIHILIEIFGVAMDTFHDKLVWGKRGGKGSWEGFEGSKEEGCGSIEVSRGISESDISTSGDGEVEEGS